MLSRAMMRNLLLRVIESKEAERGFTARGAESWALVPLGGPSEIALVLATPSSRRQPAKKPTAKHLNLANLHQTTLTSHSPFPARCLSPTLHPRSRAPYHPQLLPSSYH